MSISPGENVGPYRVVEQLGSGGMATVFKAYHAALDRFVAIKILHPAFKKDSHFFERFKREARIVAKLEHPHIIPIYDFNEYKHEPYLVMRFVEGDTLKPKMNGRAMPPKEILELMRPVCQAIGYAHQQGVLHRDLKPSNIMLSQDGQIFVTDFGLARMVQDGESTLSQDMMLGTPQYISPEQAQGISDLDGRTDIYSLGVILFEMLTGRVPFNADTPFATVHDHIYSPLPLPSSLNPDIDPAAERLLLKALAKDPSDRFATAEHLLETIEKTLGSQVPSTSAAIPQAAPPIRKNNRMPWWGLAGGIVTLFIVIVMLAGLLLWRRANRSLPEPAGKPVAGQAVGPDLRIDQDQAALQPSDDQPQPGDPNSPEFRQAARLSQQADQAMRQDLLDDAAALYQAALKTDPHYLPAYFGLSQVFQRSDNPAGSMTTLETAVANNPDDFRAHLKLGEAYILNDHPEQALATFEQTAALAPGSAIPRAAQALALLKLDQPTEAKQAIDAALQIDPANPQARLARAIYLHQQGQPGEALRELRQLLQDRPPQFDRAQAEKIFEIITK